MRKYYLSKIRQFSEPGLGTYWGHALQAYPNTDYVGGEIKVDANGLPTEKALLVLVGSKDHAKFRNDPDIVEVPAGRDSLSVQVGATDTPTKLRFRRDAKALGLDAADVDAISDNVNSWKQVVNAFGKKNNPNFDADHFDLDEA